MALLQTPRLLLRPFRADDADPMLAVFGDAEVMRYSSGVHDRQWIVDWIGKVEQTYRDAPGMGGHAVVEKGTDIARGYCGLLLFPDVGGQPEVEVGYRLARSHWGRGLATEAAGAMLQHGFQTLQLPRIVAIIDPQNVASIRVASKLGMSFEKEITFKNYDHPDHLYVLLQNDFRSQPQRASEGNWDLTPHSAAAHAVTKG